MRRNRHQTARTVSLLTAATLLLPALAAANVRLPHVIGDHMVLQRDREVPVWGWAESGEAITVTFAGHTAKATTDDRGRWSVRLPATPAGGPHEMTITGRNTIRLTDILVGEVWICSGQSNMEMGIRSVNNGEAEIAAANFPKIRLFHVPWKTAGGPQEDIAVDWRPCTPENIGSGGWANVGFSAAGYFFGREIQQKLDVPVGLIACAWGGKRIEPFTPPEGFAAVASLRETVSLIEQATPKYNKAIADAVSGMEAWLPTARAALAAHKSVAAPPAWPKHELDDSNQPTGIYNGMIHPLVPFAIRGAIWYQGESNHPDGMSYRDKMEALITGWRQVWNAGEFPFYYVQLAPFDALYPDDNLPRIWEAQSAALALPNTGMAVTVDISDLKDIHPRNKQDVGKRLALWALAKTYGIKDLVYSGPLYKSMAVEQDKVRIRFDHTNGGLASRNGKPLDWFEIAGDDHKFVKADARLDGDTVVVSSDAVAKPVAVRFGWNRAAEPNLMNQSGLPASPFRTDDWK